MRPFARWFFALGAILYLFGSADAYWQSRLQVAIVAAGGGGVTLSATGTESYTTTATTKSYTGITVGASDTTLVGTITFDTGGATPTLVTAVWDAAGTNQSMTLKEDGTVGGGIGAATFIFCRQSPTAGNKTLTFAWTTSSPSFTNALSFTGSTTGCQNGNTAVTATTVAITSGSGHIVVGLGESGSALGTLTSAGNTCPTGAPTCVVYSDSSSGSVVNAFSEIAAGAGTVNIGTSNSMHSVTGVDVAP